MAFGKILFVSGNPSLCYVFQTLFGGRFTILCAKDPVQAHRLLRHHHPAVLITDLDFDTEENVELVQYVQSSWLHSMPVVALSTNQQVLDRLPAGENLEHFHKPFNPLRLLEKATKLMAKEPAVVAHSTPNL